jgi:hypothetical protein
MQKPVLIDEGDSPCGLEGQIKAQLVRARETVANSRSGLSARLKAAQFIWLMTRSADDRTLMDQLMSQA